MFLASLRYWSVQLFEPIRGIESSSWKSGANRKPKLTTIVVYKTVGIAHETVSNTKISKLVLLKYQLHSPHNLLPKPKIHRL